MKTDLNVRQILSMNAFEGKDQDRDPDSLLSHRLDNFGAASVLFYQEPIEMVSASGCWMTSADGIDYLDFYNNVPSVGHSHPKVINAITEQITKLNTNTRYLVGVVDRYLDKLKSTFPENLDNILLCCTGSEANDLAMRLAMKRSGKTGFIVTETAYHGNTSLVTEVSPSALKSTPLKDNVVTVPPPCSASYEDDIRGGFTAAVKNAIELLEQRGFGCAALLFDSIFSSDGVHSHPEGFLSDSVDLIREKGGLFIADEVQPGFGRTGSHMWGFQRHNVIPDLVTMGKPMGNGFPMAGVAAQSSDVKLFCEDIGYFNTFGGNPVAAAAGLAVLEVIEEEKLMENSLKTGIYLKEGLKELQKRHPVITDVRGSGLFIGVDLCHDGNTDKPAPDLTTDVINLLKAYRILIGAAGKYGNTLKLRPPLCLTSKEADIFLDSLDKVLKELV